MAAAIAQSMDVQNCQPNEFMVNLTSLRNPIFMKGACPRYRH